MERGYLPTALKSRLHQGPGQAIVTIAGTTFYVDKLDTDKSQQRYRHDSKLLH